MSFPPSHLHSSDNRNITLNNVYVAYTPWPSPKTLKLAYVTHSFPDTISYYSITSTSESLCKYRFLMTSNIKALPLEHTYLCTHTYIASKHLGHWKGQMIKGVLVTRPMHTPRMCIFYLSIYISKEREREGERNSGTGSVASINTKGWNSQWEVCVHWELLAHESVPVKSSV